jgi:hypothetical protein
MIESNSLPRKQYEVAMPKGTTNEDRAKVKFRVIEFELEGGNANVENSIRQLAHAFTNHGNGGPARVATPKPPKELSAGAPAEDIDEVAAEAEYIKPTDVEIGAPPAKPAKPRSVYMPRAPQYIHDLTSLERPARRLKRSPHKRARRGHRALPRRRVLAQGTREQPDH